MQARALVLEAHHTTHIEGTHLNLNQSERLISGEKMQGVDSEEVKELLNYRKAFDFVMDMTNWLEYFCKALAIKYVLRKGKKMEQKMHQKSNYLNSENVSN